MHWLDHKIPPPVVGALVAAGMWGAAALGPACSIPAGPKLWVVAVIAAIGVAFDLTGLLAFHTARTTINPLTPGKTSALVTGGVYRITRNPMYVGMALLLLAWAAYLCALLPFAGIAVFVLYITHFQIVPEEQALTRIFGEQYESYAARVRRWL